MTIKLYLYDTVDTTMNEACRLLESDFNSYLNAGVLSYEQRKGRGRHARKWVSPKGNLYLTFMLDSVSPRLFSQYALLWGLSLKSTIEGLLPLRTVQCKWPNDVLVDGKKVAGFLIERFTDQQNEALLVGIGVNIVSAPADTIFPATSLDINLPPEELAQAIYQDYQKIYHQWQEHGFEKIRKMWLNSAWRRGQEINIRQNDRSMVGIFETIDSSGAILIKDSEGVCHKLYAGDVF